MYFLKNVNIVGFWGTRSINLKFKEHSNFLIGINGSGKTTLVNLIVSALEGDFENLINSDFSEIIINLKKDGSTKVASLKITKNMDSLRYYFRQSAKDSYIDFLIDELQEFYRYPMHFRREGRRISKHLVKSQMSKLFNLSWLSIHRTTTDFREIKERYESSIDLKLDELSNDLVRLFSFYNQRTTTEIDQFQKQVFLSLLYKREKQDSLVDTFLKLDSKKEKEALESIFKQFNLDIESSDLKAKINNHFTAFDKAKSRLIGNNAINLTEFSVLFGTDRIDFIVEKWNEHLTKKKIIEEPKHKFLNILNSMMQRKNFYINKRNELEIETQSGKNLSLKQLSSGEKQLLIILGEAFLQEGKRFIYFADEPELSLHVFWQEHLVQHLKQLNPNAQIIFATHSPDIVSCFGENIIDMEQIITENEVRS